MKTNTQQKELILNTKGSLHLLYIKLTLLLLPLLIGLTYPSYAQERERRRQVNAPTSPTITPTPTPSTTSSSQTQTLNTVDDLRFRIQEILRRPQLASALTAIKIVSLDNNRILYEENAQKLMIPASNMKSLTVAAALDRLSPDYRFVTSIYAPTRPNEQGTIQGDLIIYGRGDPTIAASFNNGNYFKAIDDLASKIVSAGVKRIEGDLIGDESYFTGPPFGIGWEWDDLQWYYGAEISALTINDNAVDLTIKPGANVGSPCIVTLGPNTPLIKIDNQATTTNRGTTRELIVHRPVGENLLEISGSLPLNDPGYSGMVAISKPAILFASMLRSSLESRGISITGRTRVVTARDRIRDPLSISSLVELTNLQSPPLSFIAARTLKPSQNLYTELILRAMGKATYPQGSFNLKTTTADDGISTLKNFLRTANINVDQLRILDGSGLARNNLITANAMVQLLVHMSRHRYGQVFRDALPVAGIDGTLRNRMRGTVAASNVRAKTGTLTTVSALSGYLTTLAGERLAFSIIINNHMDEVDAHREYIDPVLILLASFNDKPAK
jgi:serine-type D-Ala-D-Ala carboxypeptidase/endopeptidase (penicillin-binding protein 4)